jgi:hypothetical protein
MLIVAKDGDHIKRALFEKNIESSIIGKIRSNEQCIWAHNLKNTVLYNEKDEIYKLF